MATPLFKLLPRGALPILKEIARHLLRRPVVGVCAVARRADGQILLIRRGDTGEWALPGGTLEWGETLHETLERELLEEAGSPMLRAGRLLGVYAAPHRDARFHAVTVLVEATVADEIRGPDNPLEVLEAGFFPPNALPAPLCYGFDEMLGHALSDAPAVWE